MLLAIDIGNTNIVIGGWNKDTLLFEFRLQSDIGRTVDEYRASVTSLLQLQLGAAYTVSAAIISSVVPPLTGTLVDLVKQTFAIDPLIVGVGTKTGIAIRISDPVSVGADRIVNSVAAKTLYGKKSIVVDFGTATTFDYINDNGDYEGGIIAPGLHTSLESLVSKTAKLPRIELAWPKTIIGKSTVAAMQSGAMVGYVCMVDGVLAQIEKEVGPLSVVIATGGLGAVITEHSERIDIYDGTLTLKGMQLIAQMNGIG